MTLAKATAQDIQQELTTRVGLRELSLFTEYLRACRRGRGIVFAISNDLVMTNEYARQVLDPQDQAALLAHAAELLTARKRLTGTLNLPSGARARLSCTPVPSEAGPAGGVVRALLTREAELIHTASAGPQLPGVVGSGALWLRASHDIAHHYREREWLTVDGESGVGKLAIIKAVHAQHSPAAPRTVIDFAADSSPPAWAPRLREALTARDGTVVLRHLHRLALVHHPAVARALSAARGSGASGPWVVATLDEGAQHAVSPDVLKHFPYTVTVPPLRHHIDDVRDLVPFLLRKLTHEAVTCAPATVQLLLRTKWPGNIAQLRGVLHKVVRRRRTGRIEPEDLPPVCRTVTRRVLTPLESMERDAIVRSLLDAEGNKTHAAHGLGMSRATIYRKIRDYGIDIPG